MVVLHVTPMETRVWHTSLAEALDAAGARDLLVFVHGYNVSFEEAVLRTAQIAYDLAFPGEAICYSWPSQGGVLEYLVDAANVSWTVPHLVGFLESLQRDVAPRRIHLLAHSMGNRAVTAALQLLAAKRGPDAAPLLEQVVMAAPDVDAEVFGQYLVPAMRSVGRRLTLYASERDDALTLSSTIHGGPRAGSGGEDVVVVPGLDTVEVSGVTGSHSYIGNNGRVLGDLRALLEWDRDLNDKEGDDDGLREAWRGDVRYWILVEPPERSP
jgi:esterase/lipase superfamily enzyme